MEALRKHSVSVARLWSALQTFYDVTEDDPDVRCGGALFKFLHQQDWTADE